MSAICPRGYHSALKYYYPFPTYQALEYARSVCRGEKPDWEGHQEVSQNNYLDIRLPDLNGFTKAHAERWIDVCNGLPCDKRSKRCRPIGLSVDIDTICADAKGRSRSEYPTATKLYNNLHKAGITPFGQVIYSDKAIGILDTDHKFHISRPSAQLQNVNTIRLT